MRLDPRTVSASADDRPGVVAVFGKPAEHRRRDAGADRPAPDGGRKLWLAGHSFSIDAKAPPSGVAIADVIASGDARAAVGVSDEDGMLEWIELAPEDKPDATTSDAMLKLLAKLGCSSRALVAGDVRAFLGGSLDTSGQAAIPPTSGVRLIRTPAPGARPYFESTELVPFSVWNPLQQQRVKWRPTLAPPDKPAASGAASSGSASAPPPSPP
jgi:hypothetical protein